MHPLDRRKAGACFIPMIDLENYEVELLEAIKHQARVEKAVDAMLSGTLTPDDMLDTIEDCVPGMDDYIDMCEDSVEDFLLSL